MTEARTTSIEEHVMRAARSYLYGHPLAWDVRDSRIASQAPASAREPVAQPPCWQSASPVSGGRAWPSSPAPAADRAAVR